MIADWAAQGKITSGKSIAFDRLYIRGTLFHEYVRIILIKQ
jgi:hypothetical protein